MSYYTFLKRMTPRCSHRSLGSRLTYTNKKRKNAFSAVDAPNIVKYSRVSLRMPFDCFHNLYIYIYTPVILTPSEKY